MHTAYIALGANLPSHAGKPAATLASAVTRLETLGRILARSSLYSTAPVGLADQPRFVNAVVALETDLNPRELLRALLAVEHAFDRDRSAGIANGPRTLDLDILLFDHLTVEEPDLQIPHPRLADRAFVLIPLAEIAPTALDPRSGRTAAELLEALRATAPEEFSELHRFDHSSWPVFPASESIAPTQNQ
jgi:2-amino-4-hydroxy-6-hydroxymethyldihydropteridine diphosphokinase